MFFQKKLSYFLFVCALLFNTSECFAMQKQDTGTDAGTDPDTGSIAELKKADNKDAKSESGSDKDLKELTFTQERINRAVLIDMIGKSLPENVKWPVQPAELSYLTISYWGYDDQVHVGHMVVHAKVAQEVLEIFAELFGEKFPIERMELIDQYDANDERSMAANNSSAFCCRAITDKPGVFSKHSYGIAIDINPLINPYIKWSKDKNKWIVYPEAGKTFVDLPADGASFPVRTESHKGIITEESPCYKIFKKHGWQWGGDWTSLKDYQHFEKALKDIGL